MKNPLTEKIDLYCTAKHKLEVNRITKSLYGEDNRSRYLRACCRGKVRGKENGKALIEIDLLTK